jgi:hypothetical protein
MQKLSGALEFAQFPQFLQTNAGVMLFPVPGCSRIF